MFLSCSLLRPLEFKSKRASMKPSSDFNESLKEYSLFSKLNNGVSSIFFVLPLFSLHCAMSSNLKKSFNLLTSKFIQFFLQFYLHVLSAIVKKTLEK